MRPFIFGQKKPGGSVDNKPLSSDIQTFKMLRTAFVADPQASDAGGWWGQAYTMPDIALNHPSRWNIITPGLTNPIPQKCLATGTGSSQMDCAEFNTPQPDNLWLSLFHHMRGFFITSGASPGSGPQLGRATAGDVLTLQARVYNYSFAPMPADSTVHVRFYFQPWKDNVPLTGGDGNPLPSVLIDEEKLAPIPPFNNQSSDLNPVLATTTFDTSAYSETKNGGLNVAFWVVVLGENADGTLMAEMPDHGLSAIPGDITSLGDVQIDPYSNNVGFYRVAFPILAKNLLGATSPTNTGSINIGKVDLSAMSALPGESIVVSSKVITHDESLSGVGVSFFDGDPREGGQAFAVDHLSYVGGDSTYNVSALFQPKTCGTRELFVVANRGKANEVIRRAPPLQVSCTKGGYRFAATASLKGER